MNTQQKYQTISKLKLQNHSILRLCKLLEVSQSGYYHSLRRGSSQAKVRRNQLTEKVKEVFCLHKKRYGRIRIHRVLQQQGVQISERMVGSIMRRLGLVARKKRPYRPKTTQAGGLHKSAPNLLKNHHYTKPNQCLVGDITYVATKEGWLYLAGFMDIYSRVIKGYHLAETMPTSLVLKALGNAVHQYPALKSAVIHSDRGCQYTSHSYQQKLTEYDLNISMGAKGHCYDNAAIESFWSTLKTECFPESGVFETKAAAKAAVFEYIESYYNTQRLHSALNYISPLAAEKAA